MKFASKLFLCVLLVLTAALSFVSYFTVSATFRSSLEHQTQEALQQHQLVKYALQADLLTAANQTSLTEDTVQTLAEQTADSLSVQLSLEQIPEDDQTWDTGSLGCMVQEVDGADLLEVTSCFAQGGATFRLVTQQDITYVFTESQRLERSCRQVLLAAIGIGSLLSWLLSWLLTRPIQRLEETSAAFARGDYAARLTPTSGDEIGQLTCTYNGMADTIQEKIADLEQAVEQRERFVAAFAHELKTPMTSIIGYADTLYQKALPPEQVQEAAGFILNEGLRLEALSFKLMELITLKRQQFLLEEMSMEGLLQDLGESTRALAQARGVTVDIRCQPGYVRMEYDLMKTMLLNLVDNGTKSGGSRVTVTGTCGRSGYCIEIEDNGRGIPEAELERITEAFYMVDKSRSRQEHGAGLGLALCQQIAAIHRATMEFDSLEGVGTTVEVTLPQAEEAEP